MLNDYSSKDSRELNERFRNLYEAMAQGIVCYDRSGKIAAANPAALRILGLSMEDLLTRTNTDPRWKLFKPDGSLLSREEQPSVQALKTGENVCGSVLGVWNPREKRVKWLLVNAVWDCGRKDCIYATFEDVSDFKKSEVELAESIRTLEMTFDGVVQALATVSERKDPYVAGHQRGVAQLACSIAAKIGLSGNEIEGVKIGGLLHDIGKIGIPAEILNKPGPLTQAEMSIVRAHCLIGYEILQPIPFSRPVAQMVVQHHERLDGSGYPQGLSDEEIILEAKVLAVADVVEAMGSHRPYRPAHSMEDSLREIVRNSGRLYDRRVVDACLMVVLNNGKEVS